MFPLFALGNYVQLIVVSLEMLILLFDFVVALALVVVPVASTAAASLAASTTSTTAAFLKMLSVYGRGGGHLESYASASWHVGTMFA